MTIADHLRKGWCPGALRPMRSGDGLLVRLRPRAGAFSVSALRTIARAASRFGSGEIDLTNRGNLQLRGVSEDAYEAALAMLDAEGLIDRSSAAEAVRNVIVDPLSGIDPARADIRGLAANIEAVLLEDPRFWALPGKFGFSLSGTPEFRIGGRTTDIMIASNGGRLSVCLDGAADVVCEVSSQEAVAATEHLALVFLELRENDPGLARMRNAVERIGAATIFAMGGLKASASPVAFRESPSPAPVGLLAHHGKTSAAGIGLPFGRIAADQLDALCQAAASQRVDEVRTSPERVLVFPMDDGERGASLLEAAVGLGLITAEIDARLAMDVCPGAPACGNASTDTRGDAARLVEAFDSTLRDYSWHVSGCEKGCARRTVADFTIVGHQGLYDLIRGGIAGDQAVMAGVKPEELGEVISRYIMETAS